METPVTQFAEPLALVATTLTTHTLVGVLPEFGIGSGGPKRQPTLVQFRLLPVCPEVRLVRVSVFVALTHDETPVSEVPMSGTLYGSGTVLPPPPVYRPLHARFLLTLPLLS